MPRLRRLRSPHKNTRRRWRSPAKSISRRSNRRSNRQNWPHPLRRKATVIQEHRMADELVPGEEPIVEETHQPTLAEHRAEFPTPTGRRPPPIDPQAPLEPEPSDAAAPVAEKMRHRAKSQRMRAEDVPRLKEADRKRKEAEDRAAKAEAELQ